VSIEDQNRLALRNMERDGGGWKADVYFDGEAVARSAWKSGESSSFVAALPRKFGKWKKAMAFAETLAPIVYPDDLELPANIGGVLGVLQERAVKNRQWAGLTRGSDKALAALGLTPVPSGYVSTTMRVRVTEEENRRLKNMSIGRRSEVVRRGLAATED